MNRDEVREHIHMVPAQPGYFLLIWFDKSTHQPAGYLERDPIIAWRIHTSRTPDEARSTSYPISALHSEAYNIEAKTWAVLSPDGRVLDFDGATFSSEDEWLVEARNA